MRQWEHVSPEFAEVSLEADRAPRGAARVRAHEEALRMARAHGSFAEEFVARSDLTSAMYYVPDDPVMLTHIAWLRSTLAPEHALAPADRHDVLWKLKWAVDKVEEMPEVPLDAWRAAIDDVEAALTHDGHHLRPVHAARARFAHTVGDPQARDEHLARWRETPRDELSDCHACEAREQAALVAHRDPAAALELLRPVVAGELTCGEEPQLSLSYDAELRTLTGDVDGAAASFRRAWHLASGDPTFAQAVARCLRVLVRLGNTDRAVDHLVPRLGWLDELPAADDRMWFAGTAAWVLAHGMDLEVVPPVVAGRNVADVEADLRRTADELVRAFDARAGSTVVSAGLAAALDDALVADGPTLPPTHLPHAAAAPAPTVEVATGADLVALADRVREAVATLDPAVHELVSSWHGLRDTASGMAAEPAEWSAVALLDRHAAQDLAPDGRRAYLESARAAATRAGDDLGAERLTGDLAVVDVLDAAVEHGPASPEVDGARAATRAVLEGLEARLPADEAAALWRRFAHDTWPPDAAELSRHAAGLYARAGNPRREALCLLEAGLHVVGRDPGAAEALVEQAAPGTDGPALVVLAHDVRARAARVRGDVEGAVAELEAAQGLRRLPDALRAGPLFGLCDLLVDLSAWDRLEARGADALALATRLHDPVGLAVAQRHLGLAWLETGRPAEAAELLEAALPVIREHLPDLGGPVGWALGNACVALGQWPGARTAFASASASFEAAGRTEESGHAQYRAGNAAWDDGDTEAAGAHFEDAVAKARATGTVHLLAAALRSAAALRAATGDLEGGLADLDAALPEAEALDATLPPGHAGHFDAEELEPDVLRQGAHLLARAGRTDAAVERLARAEALVGADLERVLRAEGGMVLADADRVGEAEPRLRRSLEELRALGPADTRVDAAGSLARALDRAGHPAEAEEVWATYGPDA